MVEIEKRVQNLKKNMEISLNRNKVNLLIKNARVINTSSGNIYRCDVAVCDEKIVGFGDYSARHTIDIKGMYLAPGFIDGHTHIESSMVKIPKFAKGDLPCGTTSVIIDPHEIVNVGVLKGIRYMLSSTVNPMLV